MLSYRDCQHIHSSFFRSCFPSFFVHARRRLNDNKSNDLPIPLYTPPCPARTHTLKRAVVASHTRYQLLKSILPVVKIANMHFSSAESVYLLACRAAIMRVIMKKITILIMLTGTSSLIDDDADSTHLHEIMRKGNFCSTSGKLRGPNFSTRSSAGMSPTMSKHDVHSWPKEPRHSTEGW